MKVCHDVGHCSVMQVMQHFLVAMCSWPILGVFIARGKEDALVTKNLVPGESVYGEKRINVEVG